ncbi:MAG: TonB-dependent receptor [Bacteroidota bacterium]
MLQHLLGGLLLMQTFLLIAQNADNLTIDGTVVDSSGDPVVYAYVKLDSFRTGTTTDLSGNFNFNAVPSGHHQISVRMFGFKTATKRVEVVTGSIITIHFSLEQEIQSLETVVINVESAKERKENSAEAVDVIETKEVKLQSADLGEVMAKTEGIGMQRVGGLRFNTRFALNGLSDDQIRFFFDEIPLNFTPCAFGIANVSINAINRIGMYKGVVPIQFDADALGGAVNLVSPTIFYEGIAGSISYQYGSFNTHRVANHLSYASDNSWLSIATGGFFDYTDNNYEIDVARLSLFWNTRYMWSFFVGWESAGLQQFKAQVSDQTTHADGATYSIKTLGIQYAHSIEIQNLTHTNVFDLYGVQRPG